MGAKVDYAALKKFRDNMAKLNKQQTAQFTEAAVKELAARLLRKVTLRTPVGKPPERPARGKRTIRVKGALGKTRTFMTADEARYQRYWSGYKGGTLRRNWTVGEVVRKGDAYTIEIINPTEYAVYVEYGHRQTPGRYVPALGKTLKKGWVNGRFMLTISEQELRRDAPGILQRKLTAFAKGALHAK